MSADTTLTLLVSLPPTHAPHRRTPADPRPEAIAAAQRGDRAAFGELYDACAPRVYALCVGLAGGRGDADDLVQDVFVRVWEQLGSFRGECAFSTWLHRVAVNCVLASRRSDGRRALRVAIDADLASDGVERQTTIPTAAARTVDTGLSLDLEWAIGQLPAGARAVFLLYDVEGFQHAEIAEQLGIAEGTSKAHLFRARRLLRELLDS